MITILAGDDNYKIQEKVKKLSAKLEPSWKVCNYHRFAGEELEKAINCALTPAFGSSGNKLVLVEDCNFKQLQLDKSDLEALLKIPPKTDLVIIANSVDRRLKIVKSLLAIAKLIEFNKFLPWKTDEIANSMRSAAKARGLSLTSEVSDYLALAIGNDTARAYSELEKLAIYAGRDNKKLTLALVQALVPEQTQSSLQLADAVRRGQTARVLSLLKDLETQANPPLVICRTLQTQFRTWLWVKAALASGIKQDSQIATSCQIANPNRVYYLRQDVAAISLKSLSQALTALLELEIALKNSYSNLVVLCCLLDITRLFTR